MVMQGVHRRFLIDLCLKRGREQQNPQTRWIHGCYGEKGIEGILIYETTCFILALLRSKVGDQMREGQALLNHLLHFQTPSGNFPLYLHEYPYLRNRNLALHLLVPFFWIKRLFASLFPSSLRTRFDRALRSLYQCCLEREKERAFPPFLTAKLRGFEQKLTCHPPPETTIDWGHLLMAYQMMGKEEEIVPQALSVWNQRLHLFSGTPLNEWQRGLFPEITLFDCFMAEGTGSYSQRLLAPHLVHLHAGVIFPFSPPQEHFLLREEELIFQITTREFTYPKGFHLLRLLWGESERPHSLVCQEREMKIKRCSETEFVLTYPETVPPEKESEELSFYLDKQSDISLLINGKRGTLFCLGDEVRVLSSTQSFVLCFSLAEGEGTFCGHLSFGNRPSQLLPHKLTSYDWKITLRTLHRLPKVKIALTLKCLSMC